MSAMLFLALVAASPVAAVDRWDAPGMANPVLPGYFADPSIVEHDGRWYLYATVDPWGAETLSVWVSDDLANWTHHSLNWPTKAAASSAESSGAMVWAPSVVKGRDGRFHMYVSVGSEVWVGVADTPLGPWRDANGGKPLISRNYKPGYHMIDAEAFVDDDGQAYLYWGSGLNWVNGRAFVVKLKPDMVTFDGEPKDVTPANYFEGPFLFKAKGRYLLTYSAGNTTKDTYQVRYAVGTSPMGPFTEAPNSPILTTDAVRRIISPGHHSIFMRGGKPYILYHRQGLPFDTKAKEVKRQIAIDPLPVTAEGLLARVVPTHEGGAATTARQTAGMAAVLSGVGSDAAHEAGRAGDDNYATLWKPKPGGNGWLQADLGSIRDVKGSVIRPEYATRPYRFRVETSEDGRTWRTAASDVAEKGSPLRIKHPATARYVRISPLQADTGVFEWTIE